MYIKNKYKAKGGGGGSKEQFSKRELFRTPDLMLESNVVEQISSF